MTSRQKFLTKTATPASKISSNIKKIKSAGCSYIWELQEKIKDSLHFCKVEAQYNDSIGKLKYNLAFLEASNKGESIFHPHILQNHNLYH